jgi:hypothetical protein
MGHLTASPGAIAEGTSVVTDLRLTRIDKRQE